jgi:hypothetical protein
MSRTCVFHTQHRDSSLAQHTLSLVFTRFQSLSTQLDYMRLIMRIITGATEASTTAYKVP